MKNGVTVWGVILSVRGYNGWIKLLRKGRNASDGTVLNDMVRAVFPGTLFGYSFTLEVSKKVYIQNQIPSPIRFLKMF